MSKVLGLAAASLLLAGAPAAARTVTLAVTKDGFVPRSVAIAGGDSVVFANQDSVAHQLVLKPSTGFACTPGGLVIQPAGSVTCTFSTATKYTVSDSAQRKAAFKATITVSVPAGLAVTLKAPRALLTYGVKETLSGTIAVGLGNQKVDVIARECGASASKVIASPSTGAGGAWTATAQPLRNTAYQARYKGATSAESQVRVRPAVRLGRTAPQRFAVRVRAAQSLVGKVVAVQRYDAARRRWVRVRLVALGRTVPSVAPTVISAASFRARVRAGRRVRVLLPRVQAAPCYAPSASNVVRS